MSRAKRKRKPEASNREIANLKRNAIRVLQRIAAPSWLDLGLEQLHKFVASAARGETDAAALTAAVVCPAIDGLVPPPTVAQIQAVRSGQISVAGVLWECPKHGRISDPRDLTCHAIICNLGAAPERP